MSRMTATQTKAAARKQRNLTLKASRQREDGAGTQCRRPSNKSSRRRVHVMLATGEYDEVHYA